MITSRSPKRSMARALRCSSQSCAICSSSSWCSALSVASYPWDSARMTSIRRSDRMSISCLISVSVRIPLQTLDGKGLFPARSPVAELFQPVLVDPEVVGELVQHGDPYLLAQLVLVGEAPLQRPAEDRDLVRHVLVGLPEPVEAGVVRALVLDHDRDVLQAAGELRRQLGQGRVDDLLEAHQRGRSGGRTWKIRTASMPSTNPPTCAANATPPPPSGCVIEKPPCQSWNANHAPRKSNAESGTGRNPKSSVTTLAWGRSTK